LYKVIGAPYRELGNKTTVTTVHKLSQSCNNKLNGNASKL
jgi:hypothetical protein